MNDKIRLILGTMSFGSEADTDESIKMLKFFINKGYNEIDTAYIYNKGKTEKILGTFIKEYNSVNLSLATKVHPRVSSRLDGNAVKEQLIQSLNRLERDNVDILYFHLPDLKTPVEEPLKMMAEILNKGRIKEFGLSNYPADMVIEIWEKCKNNGWPLPSVYQGMYNAISRNIETELLPVLRKLGMRFYAYNPLAGGILTGKYLNYENLPVDGRFFKSKLYRERYWKKSNFDVIKGILKKCNEFNITPSESAYRWLAYHSSLSQHNGDGLIIGASKLSQLDSNINAIEKGVLPESFANYFETAWEIVKKDSPDYYNFYE